MPGVGGSELGLKLIKNTTLINYSRSEAAMAGGWKESN